MADNFLLKSSTHRKKEDPQPSKKQRLESPIDKQSVVVSTPTRIIGLNDDCLMKIFEPLDLQSLFNVAIASEWLRPAARSVYERNFGAIPLEIANCDDFCRHNTRLRASTNFDIRTTFKLQKYETWNGFIQTNGLMMGLQYLRCFGALITKITIYYNKSPSKRYQYIDHYINQYCNENLTEIFFRCKPNMSIKNFVKPFVNVKNVTIWHMHLGKQLPLFPKWFPNLQTLSLYNVSANPNSINVHFPHLTSVFFGHFMYNALSKGNLIFGFLPFNRQVQSIGMEGWTNTNRSIPLASILHLIKDNYPLISKLSIRLSILEQSDVNAVDVQRLVSGNPCLVELHLPDFRFKADYAVEIIRRLTSLKKFESHILYSPKLTKLVSELNNGWHCDDIGYHLINLRHEN